MKIQSLLLLLLVRSAAASSNGATTAAVSTVEKTGNPVGQLVGYVKDSVVRTVDGCGQLWKNHGRCNEIRAKQRDHREQLAKQWEMEGRLTKEAIKEKLKMVNGGISYDEYVFLVKGKEDRGKLMNVGFLMWGAPRYLPYALMFYPDMLPSPFTSLTSSAATGRESVLEKISRQRTHAVMKTLLNIEQDAKVIPSLSKINIFGKKKQERAMDTVEKLGEQAAKLFATPGARGSFGAQVCLNTLEHLLYRPEEFTRAENRLVDVPKPILKGVTMAVDGPSPLNDFLPNFMRRGKVISHIKKISDGDEFLVGESIDLSSLSPTHLVEACTERCIGGPGRSDDELRDCLGEWLKLSVEQPTDRVQETGQFYNSNLARLSLLCYYGLDASRDARSTSYLPRLLYQGQMQKGAGGSGKSK